ncbi:Ubiquitin-conjugating enzyme E2 C [Dimargaris xerosporica]|nr:Ubiquitin-conjugating enzyme E2 C [Dimargaris xerosporica]
MLTHDSNSATAASDGLNVTKRLRSELMSLMMAGIPGVSAFPESDNMYSWVGTITGATGTVYEGLSFKLSLKFPTNYPYSAPTIRFETPCYHPNVDTAGNICLDILKEKWSAVYNVQTILLSLQSLLGEPNNDSPLNGEAAQLWSNQAEFKKQLLKHYQDHAQA